MNWLKRKIVDPLLGFLKQGVSPSDLAWAITAGIIIAYIPIFGAATLICLLIIWVFKLNPAAVILVNQLAYPLQFVLFLPFLRAGEWLFSAPNVPFDLSQIFTMAKEDFWGMFKLLWKSNVYGLVVYVITAIPMAFILHTILKMVLSKIPISKISSTPTERNTAS